MNIGELLQAFLVFNQNAANHIVYAFSTNWYLFLLVIGGIATTVMGVMAKTEVVIREEQNVI